MERSINFNELKKELKLKSLKNDFIIQKMRFDSKPDSQEQALFEIISEIMKLDCVYSKDEAVVVCDDRKEREDIVMYVISKQTEAISKQSKIEIQIKMTQTERINRYLRYGLNRQVEELVDIEAKEKQDFEILQKRISECIERFKELYEGNITIESYSKALNDVEVHNIQLFNHYGKLSPISNVLGQLFEELLKNAILVQQIYECLSEEQQKWLIVILSETLFSRLRLGDNGLVEEIKNLYQQSSIQWKQKLIIAIILKCLKESPMILRDAIKIINDNRFKALIIQLRNTYKYDISIQENQDQLIKYPPSLTQNLVLLNKSQLICLIEILKCFTTKNKIQNSVIKEVLISKQIQDYIYDKNSKDLVLELKNLQEPYSVSETVAKALGALQQLKNLQSQEFNLTVASRQDIEGQLQFLSIEDTAIGLNTFMDEYDKMLISLLASTTQTKYSSLQFDFNTIALNVGTNQKEEVKFDYVYKYHQNDDKQVRKCIKQLHKQALLPKIMQCNSHLFVIPLFEPNQILSANIPKKSNLLYIIIKDILEMHQQTSSTAGVEKTPRNQVSLEIYEFGQEMGLVAKLDITNATQILGVLIQHHQTRSKCSLKMNLRYKDLITSFVFLRKEDLIMQSSLDQLILAEISRNKHAFFIFQHSSHINSIRENLYLFKQLQEKVQKDKSQNDTNQQKDMIFMLQKQIDDLKYQLSSQTSLISQLYIQKPQNKSNKKNKRQKSNKLASVDFDQVIIEEDGEDGTGQQESKFEGELSIVAAAANNQGETVTDSENTQVIEDISLLRKLSLELNRNYEKFNEFRRSLNFYQNNNNQTQKVDVKTSSLSSSIARENSTQGVAQEVEKQFKSLLQERLVQSQREKQLIEEALGKCTLNNKKQKQQDGNQEIEKILIEMNKSYYKNMKDESIKSPETSSYMSKNHHNNLENDSEDSFDIGEESIANEREQTIMHKTVRNVPKEQEPSKFMGNLNQTQGARSRLLRSSFSSVLPPKQAAKIVKLYNTDQSMTSSQQIDSQKGSSKMMMPQFFGIERNQRLQNAQSFNMTNPKLGQTLSTLNSINVQSSSVTSIATLKGNAKHKNNSLVNLKQNQTMQKPVIGKVTTINLHKANKYSGQKQQNYQSIAGTAATALKTLNQKVIQKKRKDHINQIQEALKEKERFSRSPSIKDERGSLVAMMERPKTILMGEKNHHQLYFKINSNENSLKHSVIQSPKPKFNIINEGMEDQEDSSGMKNNLPRMSVNKKAKQLNADSSIRMLDQSEKAMIAKFYHNQPKSPQLDPAMLVNKRRLTDLKEARIKNRSESRHRQRQHQNYSSLNRSGIQIGGGSLCMGGANAFGSAGGAMIHQNQNVTLDETIQVVKDILTIKRNQSQTSITQMLPQGGYGGCSNGGGNQSQLGINASILFDNNNNNNNHNKNSYTALNETQYQMPLRKPPTSSMQNIKSGKENLDEFFVMYESFKQGTSNHNSNNIIIPQRLCSPEGTKRLFNNTNVMNLGRVQQSLNQLDHQSVTSQQNMIAQHHHNQQQQQLQQQVLRSRSTSEYNTVCQWQSNYQQHRQSSQYGEQAFLENPKRSIDMQHMHNIQLRNHY